MRLSIDHNKALYHYLLLAVVATTLTSWFLVNSLLMILLAGCCLLDGGMAAVRKAFTYPPFLAFFAIFLLEVCGFFHTHDTHTLLVHVERKATLVAIPWVLCSRWFRAETNIRRLMWGYCQLLACLSGLCLIVAAINYLHSGDTEVFFYHRLTGVLAVNAVFFSAYVLMALLFLLSGRAPAGRGRAVSIGLFTGMMILLSSKLLLVVMGLIYAAYLWRHRSGIRRRWLWAGGLSLFSIAGMLAFTDNYIARRYKDILPEETTHALNGVSLRLIIWRDAKAILNEERAWVFGVSAGDSQKLLNEHYTRAGLYSGYQNYNFHSEYIEILVTSGIVGLAVFLAALAVVIGWGPKCMERWFAMLVIVVMACTESILEAQHPVFLTGFFAMLPWAAENGRIMRNLHYSKNRKHGIRDQHIWRSRAGDGNGRRVADASADAGVDSRGGAGG